MNARNFHSITLLVLLGMSASAQSFFKARVDTQQIKLGEPIQLTVEAEIPAGSDFEWPETFERPGLTFIERGGVDTLEKGGILRLKQSMRLTSFDSGEVSIPSYSLLLENGESLETEAIPILVYFPDVKKDQELNDIKGPREIPFNYWILLYWLAGGLALAGLLYWLWKQAQGRKRPELEISPEAQIPAGEWAMAALQELEDKELWQAGKTKAYYSELIDILRIYVERKFGLKAMESTADELIVKLKPLVEADSLFQALKIALQNSALVKYAKHHSLPAENTQALEAVRSFILSKESPKPDSNV